MSRLFSGSGRDAPILREWCEPLISRQDAPSRYRVGHVARGRAYRANGLVLRPDSDVGPDRHLRPAVRISHSPAMASGILHTIGPHERHMGRRDFSMLPGGGLRRALPPPLRNAQEPALSRREGATSRCQAGCVRSPAEQSEEKRHNG
jgi:hypothetical protein